MCLIGPLQFFLEGFKIVFNNFDCCVCLSTNFVTELVSIFSRNFWRFSVIFAYRATLEFCAEGKVGIGRKTNGTVLLQKQLCLWRTFQVLHFNCMKLSLVTCFWVISIQKNFVTATFFTLKLKLTVYQIPPLKVTRLQTDVEFVTKVTIPVCVKYFKAKDLPKISRKLKETGNLARVKDLTKSTSDY